MNDLKRLSIAVVAQLFAAMSVWSYKHGSPALAAIALVGVVGLLIDYAKIKGAT